MKKVFTIISLMLLFGATNAQNIFELNIEDVENDQFWSFCRNDYDSIIIESDDPACDWWTGGSLPYYGVSIVPYDATTPGFTVYGKRLAIAPLQGGQNYEVFYQGCDGTQLYYKRLYFYFFDFQVPEPWTQSFVWKRAGKTTTLFAPQNPMTNDCSYQWSTGYSYDAITVSQPGTYWVRIYNGCGELTDTIQVRDNVEVYRATVDLETNLNKTTWQVTEGQADYISEVKVYRDGLLVGTAPYEQGYYLDAIGSDNAARNYRVVGVSVEGEDCPIESYQKGTIHTTYYQDVNGNLNMTWNVPYVEEGVQGTLTYFQICKYDPNTDEITVVDQINASITDYTCGVNQFDGGQAVIAAVFSNGKGVEELSFSNLTTDILGIGENEENAFKVYPNPAQGTFTVEGTGQMTITNVLGQTVLAREIDGKESIELPRGIYFVKLNASTRKVVVE